MFLPARILARRVGILSLYLYRYFSPVLETGTTVFTAKGAKNTNKGEAIVFAPFMSFGVYSLLK